MLNHHGGLKSRLILQNFPRLTIDDIKACLEYASYLATE
ncbi:MAG: DUF433 domain-containing protein [Candidatus Lokiarchaeota archaeon]|nr:DUF433 domain-containing protein [Candidatus Lokiarchaeota archaeon]